MRGLVRAVTGEDVELREVQGEVRHIFSHVRHFTRVCVGSVSGEIGGGEDKGVKEALMEGSPEHLRYEFLSEGDREERGVTAEIGKVLQLAGEGKKKSTKGTKRKKKEETSPFFKVRWESPRRSEATTMPTQPRTPSRSSPPHLLAWYFTLAFSSQVAAFDLDGTLLSPSHTLTDATVSAVRRLSSSGVKVVIATGRSAPAVRVHVDRLGLGVDVPAVVYNGGMHLNFKGGVSAGEEVAGTSPVPGRWAAAALSYAQKKGLLLQYYTPLGIYAQPKNDEHEVFMRRYEALTGVKQIVVEDGYEGVREGDPEPLKILLMSHEPARTLKDVKAVMGGCTLVEGDFFVEILGEGTCKGSTTEKLCASLGVPMSSVLAFGDGDNDVEFLSSAGLGVAMRNGVDRAKGAADRVSQFGNDEDGVARELDTLREEGLIPPL